MRRLWIGIALVLVATGVLVLAGRSGSDDRVAVGDCLDVLEGLVPADVYGYPPAAEVGCDDAKAAYRVALRLPAEADCPSRIYIQRRESTPDGPITYCMTYNVDEGECFVSSPTEAGVYDCARGPRPGGIRSLRLVTGVVDAARCDDIDEPGVLAALIPDPPQTFCYQEYDTGGEPPVRSA
ncbi:MAG TPA: hypothetical protein VMZ00_15595 [Sporichthya sp.]|nr:hypothetical protein [Sporichthya sp.]